jgi:phenylpropionate dioxygenase-like ring-hydroxylating dioxygenase large terminal subunit
MTVSNLISAEAVAKALRHAWFPVARSKDIGTPRSTQLLEHRLVVFRDTDGVARVTDRRCPHRGGDLASGDIRGSRISCPYHGWQFDGGTGACTAIPALGPDAKIPANATITAYPTVERFGLVWTVIGDPLTAVPDLPELEPLGMTYLVGEPIPTDAGILASAENFRDVAHFPFVHASTMGGVRQEVERLDVRAEGFETWLTRQYSVGGGEAGTYVFDQGVVVHYHAVMPALVSGRFDYGERGQRIILECFQPLGPTGTIIYPVSGTAHNYTVSTPEQALADEEFVINEDKPVLDGLWPLEVPLDGSFSEVSIASDRYTLTTRKAFSSFVLETQTVDDRTVSVL